MLWIKEFYTEIKHDQNGIPHENTYSFSPLYETRYDSVGELYRALQREHGRCTSKVYIDRNGQSVPIGWHFVGRKKYDDCEKTYLRGVWIEVYTIPPTQKKITRHYYCDIGTKKTYRDTTKTFSRVTE